MKKRVPVLVTISLVIIAVALTVCVTMELAMRHFSGLVNEVNERRDMYEYIAEIDTLVRKNYVGVIDEESLHKALAEGYISGISDKYADYYPAEEYGLIKQQLSGSYTGFGVEITKDEKNRLVVTNLYPESAAAKAGILKQDVITAVDGSTVNGDNVRSVQSRLQNSSKLMLTVERDGVSMAHNLSSSTIVLTSVAEKVIDNTGYLRIYRFSDNTPDQFKSAYTALMEAGVENIIFDLRDNPGGSTEAALEIISYLMPRGNYANKLVEKTGEVVMLSTSDTHQLSMPTVTLVNGKTEGEAELFAGVLQEFGLTTTIGTQTYGRSRIQEHFTLAQDASAIRLSVATLQLIQGGSWEGVGLTPSQEVSLETLESFELLTEEQDLQLQAALTTLNPAMVLPPVEDDGGEDATTDPTTDDSTTDGTDGTTAVVSDPTTSTTESTAKTTTKTTKKTTKKK